MRWSFILVLSLAGAEASAQKHYLYTDGAISLAYFDPGFSVTYNYHPVRYLGMGIGMQGYVYHPASTNPRHFTPAVYADMRLRLRSKKISQYYMLLDGGVNFYRHNYDSVTVGKYIYTVPNNNGVYIGLGIGYFLRLTHRGWGPYASVKLINNFYKRNEYNTAIMEQNSINTAGGTLILSLGFRFGDDNKEWKKL